MASSRAIEIEAIRKTQRAHGPATVLAIGTTTPPNCVYQADYPDYYFRVTNSNHMVELKEKFKPVCDKSAIRKRHMHMDEEFLKNNPNMCKYMAPSMDIRHEIAVVQIPKLGSEAAAKAIEEWGQPKSKITHLILCTSSCGDMPGADYHLTKLLSLPSTVNRFMMYLQGCCGGGTVLRMAKDLAENNKGSRVLVVCSEVTSMAFRGPSDDQMDSLVTQALFGDGAAAVIVGADPDLLVERPLFEMVWTAQTIFPDSEEAISLQLKEVGMTFHLAKEVPVLIAKNVEKALAEALSPLGVSDWNSLFWIVHPGGRAIMDELEVKLELKEEKLKAARQVLGEYGNLISACVLFVMDEMRKRSTEQGKETTGEGFEWGVLLSFGPGLTVETVVLRSLPATIAAVPVSNVN